MKLLWSNLSLGGLYTDTNDDGQWQWHMMDRAWLHRLITKWAIKKPTLTFDSSIQQNRTAARRLLVKTKRKNKCYIDNQLTVEKDGTNYLSCLHTDNFINIFRRVELSWIYSISFFLIIFHGCIFLQVNVLLL